MIDELHRLACIADASEGRELQLGTERKPKFGDPMRAFWASRSNPQRDGTYVETILIKSGRYSSRPSYRLTDGKGSFYAYPPDALLFLDAKDQAPQKEQPNAD